MLRADSRIAGAGAARLLLIAHEPRAAADDAARLCACFLEPPEVRFAESGQHGIRALRAAGADLVLAELTALADIEGGVSEAVARLVRAAAGALLVALAEAHSVTAAMEAMRAGAHDYLARPLDTPALAERLGALSQRHGRDGRLRLRDVAPLAAPPSIHLVQPTAAGANGGHAEPILPMWRQEQRIIEETIERLNGNVALAAAALQISPSTIYRKRQAWAELQGGRATA